MSVVKTRFDEIVSEWGVDGRETLLYKAPTDFDRDRANRFLTNLRDFESGIIPWLKNLLS